MNSLARWENYNPYGIGLETFFSKLDKLQDTGSNFPPYNIIREGENKHILELALAGYDQEQLEVSVERNVLTVRGRKEELDNRDYSYRGLALRSFERSWTLAEDVEVEEVTFINGLLRINLVQKVPEHLKKRVLPINWNSHIERLSKALNTPTEEVTEEVPVSA